MAFPSFVQQNYNGKAAEDIGQMDIVEFLAKDGTDQAGRRFAQVVGFDNRALESHHDYIQWLFPLDEPSRAVPGSPVLDHAALAALRNSEQARRRQHEAAQRMLEFYAATSHWKQVFDHNHLRITRIIKSLRLVSGDAEADEFKARIIELAGDAPIDPTARRFWNGA
jgi:hypothetical protein